MNAMPKKGDMVQCPIDKSHQVKRLRLLAHIEVCKKNNPHKKIVECPFNAIHVMHHTKLDSHMKDCPDRQRFEALMAQCSTVHKPVENLPLFESTEDWDAEPDVGSYDPRAYCERQMIPIQPKGLSKENRLAFRDKHRQLCRDNNNAK